ncbi:MAG: gliding motility-associated C-terminal domain-containing protein [Bacteroidetes bacterium]|nr:gliding motility-associated C-terminal domain-containing protein [Bacteroidota bacterium]
MRKILLAIIVLTWFLPSLGQELVVNFTFDTVCLGGITHFTSKCTISDTAVQPRDSIVSLAWDLDGNGKFNDGNDSVNTANFQSPGLHNVGLKAITKNGLAKALYKLVPVDFLTPLFTSSSGCVQEPARFSNQTLIHGDTTVHYFWRFGDGTTLSGVKNPVHFYPDSGTFHVTLVAGFLVGCEDSVSHSVYVAGPPAVVLDFSRDTVMRKGDSLFVSVQGTYDSIRWSTKETTYTILVTKAGHYSVEAFKFSCSGQEGFNVTVTERGPEPVISNLFTPNGDGYNDRWEILNLSDFKPCQVNVYNRYGIEVFSSGDYRNDWDGSFNGKQLANDTYYYFVRCFNQNLYKGNVNILK